MANIKHTLGPWKCDWSIQVGGNIKSGWQVFDSNETELVIDIPDSEEAEANAQLIAAAPELLDACQKALSLLKALEVRGDSVRFLEQAIAKATGKEVSNG
jgi:hypothetical protein